MKNRTLALNIALTISCLVFPQSTDANTAAKPLGLRMRFDYALLGTDSVVYAGALQSYSSAENYTRRGFGMNDRLYCYIGTFGTMPGLEKKEDGGFLWKNGGGKTSSSISTPVVPSVNGVVALDGRRHRGAGHIFTEVPSPPVPTRPLRGVPQPPSTAHAVDMVPQDCGSGDYIVSNSKIQGSADLDGTLRIFLKNIKLTKGPALELSGVINNVLRDPSRPGRAKIEFAGKPQSMQIFYDGDGIIKLDNYTKFNGIIYAPNARVELGSCEVRGAIVARDIAADRDTKVFYDRELLKIDQW